MNNLIDARDRRKQISPKRDKAPFAKEVDFFK